jgi:hypothetical protein
MKFSRKLLLFGLLLPAFVSCDLEAVLQNLCQDSGYLTYCLEFKPLDKNGANALTSGTLDMDDLVIKAVRSDETEYVVYEAADWGNSILNTESIFIDFGDNDDPMAIIKSLVFETKGAEPITYDLKINEKYSESCMVDFNLQKEEKVQCTSCQKGIQEIALSN